MSPDQVARQRAYYEAEAGLYDARNVAEGDPHDVALEHVVRMLRELNVRTVLDTGCGTARALRLIAAQLPDVVVRGNDPSEAMLRVAVEHHGVPRDWLDCCSSDSLPYADGSFDAVVATGVMHHVPHPERVIEEMLRVTKRAVFISDCNVFGMGRASARALKAILAGAGVFQSLQWVRRGGHRWYESDGDGVAYSYSIFDSLVQLRTACAEVGVIPTVQLVGPFGSDRLALSHALAYGVMEARP